MNNRKREIVRRLLKGDVMTVILKDKVGYEEYFMGYDGKSPLFVDRSLGRYLIANNVVVTIENEYARYNKELYEDGGVPYILSQGKYENILRKVSRYTVGDTVEYNNLSLGSRMKGVITKENDPLGLGVCIDGIANQEHSAHISLGGWTRMVITEKTIKERRIRSDNPCVDATYNDDDQLPSWSDIFIPFR
jgi:hypothetical protein